MLSHLNIICNKTDTILYAIYSLYIRSLKNLHSHHLLRFNHYFLLLTISCIQIHHNRICMYSTIQKLSHVPNRYKPRLWKTAFKQDNVLMSYPLNTWWASHHDMNPTKTALTWMVYLHSANVFHSLIVLSRLPDTIWRLSTEKATLSTSWTIKTPLYQNEFEWPCYTKMYINC